MGNDFKDKGPKVLLTEGKNDCHVILSLCKHYTIAKTFGFYECGSDNAALKRLAALIDGAESMEIIGLVIDADKPDLAGRWQAIRDKLQHKDIQLPDKPDPLGTIIPAIGEYPRIGIWLMPNNQLDGMLEDFCSTLADQGAINFAEECVTKAQENNHSTFIAKHKTKAVIHTFLAWQDEPGMPLGQAITARTLNPDNVLAKHFTAWLTELFR